jgi:hypothetical protein
MASDSSDPQVSKPTGSMPSNRPADSSPPSSDDSANPPVRRKRLWDVMPNATLAATGSAANTPSDTPRSPAGSTPSQTDAPPSQADSEMPRQIRSLPDSDADVSDPPTAARLRGLWSVMAPDRSPTRSHPDPPSASSEDVSAPPIASVASSADSAENSPADETHPLSFLPATSTLRRPAAAASSPLRHWGPRGCALVGLIWACAAAGSPVWWQAPAAIFGFLAVLCSCADLLETSTSTQQRWWAVATATIGLAAMLIAHFTTTAWQP